MLRCGFGHVLPEEAWPKGEPCPLCARASHNFRASQRRLFTLVAIALGVLGLLTWRLDIALMGPGLIGINVIIEGATGLLFKDPKR